MISSLPSLAPAGVDITLHRHPHAAKRSTGGGETRVRLSNMRAGAKVVLKYAYIETDDLLLFYEHWRDVRGVSRSFIVTNYTFGSVSAKASSLLRSTTWKYGGAPKVEDFHVGDGRLLHSLEFELISQPSVVSPYLLSRSLPVLQGARLLARTVVFPGRFSVEGWSLLGSSPYAEAWIQKGAFSSGILSTLTGADIFTVSNIVPGVPTAGVIAMPTAVASMQPGKLSLYSDLFPGGTLTATSSLDGGILTLPERSIPGGSIVSLASIVPGSFSLGGSDLSATASLIGGGMDLYLNGGSIITSASLIGGALSATTATFANQGGIVINNTFTATPYPSTITVSDVAGDVRTVSVDLLGFSHASPQEIQILLVAPTGSVTLLLGRWGGSAAATNANLTFSSATDDAAPSTLTSGTYRPTSVSSQLNVPQAENNPYPLSLSSFVGASPNGVWSLYVYDYTGSGNSGSISGGWRLRFDLGGVVRAANSTPITIPSVGAASPYPSIITVSGVQGTLDSIRVDLLGFAHLSPNHLRILLVSPSGLTVLLMRSAGGVSSVTGLNISLSSRAYNSTYMGLLKSGAWPPMVFGSNENLTAPAPQSAPYSTTFNSLVGTNPNGTWSLYVQDDTSGSSGSIAGGWALVLTTS